MLKKAKKTAVKQLESKESNAGKIYCHKYTYIGLDIIALPCYTTNSLSKITPEVN